MKSAIKRSCFLFRDVLRNDRRVLNLEEFRDKYGRYPGDILEHNVLVNALNKINLRRINHDNSVLFRGAKVGKLGRKHFYSKIIQTEEPLCHQTWNRKFAISIDNGHWDLIHKLKESRLKNLLFKIMHNIYPTNVSLHRMGLSDSNVCAWCEDNEMETLEHFFFGCKKNKPLWLEIEKEVNIYLGKKIKLNQQIVILGPSLIPNLSRRDLLQINHVLAVGKLAISKYKYGPRRDILEIYTTDALVRNVWASFR